MPEYENDEQVAQALVDAAAQDGTLTSPDRQAREVQEQAEAPVAGDDSGATAEADSFTSIDPTSLSPENQAIYKQMQADYTRKLQTEVAPYRDLGDVDEVRNAVQFVENLTSDPDYALRVHSALTESLVQAGYTPAQAAAEASAQMQDQVEAVTGPSDGDFDLASLDPGLAARLQEQQNTLAELQQWKAEREEAEFQSYLTNELNRQEAEIRSQHPEYGDQELDTLYELAHAYGGNLFNADERFQAIKNHIVSSYMDSKTSVNSSSPAHIRASEGTMEPAREGYKGLYDANLERDVMEYMLREEAADR
jgi:hypothetical protein